MILKYLPKCINYYCFDEVDLKDGAEINLVELEFQGNCLHKDIPAYPGFVCIGDALFMAGGVFYDVPHPTFFKQISPTNYLSTAPLPVVGSSPVTWTRSPTSMDLARAGPMVAPLHDGRIFICGGTPIRSSWVEIYDPKTGQFLPRKLPAHIKRIPIARSCFQWTKELVMIYYDRWVYTELEFKDEHPMSCDIEGHQPTLLQYNLVTDKWIVFADNIPPPIDEMNKRNLIYVGGDLLFSIDYSYSWLVYDLSSRKVVGNVSVKLPGAKISGARVIDAFYVGGKTDVKSTSWFFYVFMPNVIKHQFRGVQYAKVEVVQRKDGDLYATVHMNGVLGISPYSDIYIIASSKRDAEEDMLEASTTSSKRDAEEDMLEASTTSSKRDAEEDMLEASTTSSSSKRDALLEERGKEKVMRSE
ncbi:hypothetical protein SASPL_156870 [Salvia splendens]|uniref:Uncharacterized protein n=2 Tax=Salvia splendens TaxID=180675 RepID=A0A8X8VVZ2_SALSN|nr:hypothetical protein SASPL_156870 [Salvia splendens]